jgi:hypothetical protein
MQRIIAVLIKELGEHHIGEAEDGVEALDALTNG